MRHASLEGKALKTVQGQEVISAIRYAYTTAWKTRNMCSHCKHSLLDCTWLHDSSSHVCSDGSYPAEAGGRLWVQRVRAQEKRSHPSGALGCNSECVLGTLRFYGGRQSSFF